MERQFGGLSTSAVDLHLTWNTVGGASEHYGVLSRLYNVLHRVDNAAIAWVARLEKDGAASGSDDTCTTALLNRFSRLLVRRFLDDQLSEGLHVQALATLAEMSLVSRGFPVEGGQQMRVNSLLQVLFCLCCPC